MANGIAANRLQAKGYGINNPIDTNKTRAGRANNRRVEVVYLNNN
jgi:outer membrane protein OmpA-like peptidoglycan-associated protein